MSSTLEINQAHEIVIKSTLKGTFKTVIFYKYSTNKK